MESFLKQFTVAVNTGLTYLQKLTFSNPKVVKDMAYKFSYEVTTKPNQYNARAGKQTLEQQVFHHYIAKVSEMGMCNYFYLHNVKSSLPDFRLLDESQKSFGADLSITGNSVWNVHVKCQPLESILRFGYAWLFQPNDELTYNPKNNDLIAFTAVDEAKEVYLLKIVRAYELKGKFDEQVYRKRRIKYEYLKDVPNFDRF
jgi:hypothetical protein